MPSRSILLAAHYGKRSDNLIISPHSLSDDLIIIFHLPSPVCQFTFHHKVLETAYMAAGSGGDTVTHVDQNDMQPHYADSQSSLSTDDAQAGVKNIEAVSQTWTRSSLILAYLG